MSEAYPSRIAQYHSWGVNGTTPSMILLDDDNDATSFDVNSDMTKTVYRAAMAM